MTELKTFDPDTLCSFRDAEHLSGYSQQRLRQFVADGRLKQYTVTSLTGRAFLLRDDVAKLKEQREAKQ